jgi:hypothetical protein
VCHSFSQIVTRRPALAKREAVFTFWFNVADQRSPRRHVQQRGSGNQTAGDLPFRPVAALVQFGRINAFQIDLSARDDKPIPINDT